MTFIAPPSRLVDLLARHAISHACERGATIVESHRFEE